MKNTIHLTITTTSPQFTAFPDGSIKESNKLISITNRKAVGNLPSACHPANGFRGAFRRYAAKMIEKTLIDRGEKISAETYTGLHCGSATAQPDTASNSIEELVRANDHFYMGLFGGGARLLPSKFSVQDLDIICAHNVEIGTVSTPLKLIDETLAQEVYSNDDSVSPKKPYHYLERAFFTKVDDIARGIDAISVYDVLENGIDSAITHIKGNADSIAKRKEDADAKKTDVSNLVGIERIKTGTPMALRIDIDSNATDAQIGLLLLCLQEMIHENYIGGHGRIGYGRFKVNTLNFNGIDNNITQSGGESDFTLSDEFNQYIDAAKSEIANLNTDELVSYFTKVGK